MDTERLNSKIFGWASRNNCKNWNFRFKQHLLKYDLHENNTDNNTLQQLETRMFDYFKRDWKSKIDAEQCTRPNQRNKLRTYRQFKHEYCTEPYVTEVLNRQHRIALAKFRCPLAPLRIETGRYERLPKNNDYALTVRIR